MAKEGAEIKYFGNSPRSNDGIQYESTKYSYDDKRLNDGINYESNKYSYNKNYEVKYFGSQPKNKYWLNRTKNGGNLPKKNSEGPYFKKHAKVYSGRD